MSNIEVSLEEIIEIFYLLEELNDFFHDPSKYSDKEAVERFITEKYPSINKGYYKTVWNWLPKDVQDKITAE